MSDLTERYQTGNRLLRGEKKRFQDVGAVGGGARGREKFSARGIPSCADARAAAQKFQNPLGLKVLVSSSFFSPASRC